MRKYPKKCPKCGNTWNQYSQNAWVETMRGVFLYETYKKTLFFGNVYTADTLQKKGKGEE